MGMRERMIIVGGTLDIESSPGKGTTITLILPLERVLKASLAEERSTLGAPVGAST